jgi:hypothetical protein
MWFPLWSCYEDFSPPIWELSTVMLPGDLARGKAVWANYLVRANQLAGDGE